MCATYLPQSPAVVANFSQGTSSTRASIRSGTIATILTLTLGAKATFNRLQLVSIARRQPRLLQQRQPELRERQLAVPEQVFTARMLRAQLQGLETLPMRDHMIVSVDQMLEAEQHC